MLTLLTGMVERLKLFKDMFIFVRENKNKEMKTFLSKCIYTF
jgi:hypothetical protein